MADIGSVGSQIKGMPVQKKIALIMVVMLAIAAVFLLVTFMQKADYQLLFANLSQEDGGAIIQKLTELRVPYKTEGGGIMVPADKVYELRLQLASQGLPQGGGVGYELFDKTSFTTTDFVQKLNYRRAIQGELARTIRALAEIEQCRVHLAVPEKSLFMQKQEKPKASVLVKLRAGRRLSSAQVQGIVHLISSSVEGLDPRDVAVVNNNGEMLTSASSDETMSMSSSQLEYQRNIERDIETRVVGMLEPVVGKGKARAKVSAVVDFTKIEKTEEKYDPDSQVIRSEQRSSEKSKSGAPGGIPGTASNLPEKTPVTVQAQGAQSEKKNDTINYEINKVVSRVISPTGDLKRISAVVLVDGTYAAAQGSKELKYVPRTEEAVQQFEDMVKKAIGFSVTRGDEVKVVNMPFETAPQEELGEPEKSMASTLMSTVTSAAKYVVPLVAIMLLFLFVIRPLMAALMAPANGSQPMQRAGAQGNTPGERAMETKVTPGKEQLVDWAKKNPGDAASLVKGWMDEK